MLTHNVAKDAKRTINLLVCGEMRNDLSVISMARRCLEVEISRDQPGPAG